MTKKIIGFIGCLLFLKMSKADLVNVSDENRIVNYNELLIGQLSQKEFSTLIHNLYISWINSNTADKILDFKDLKVKKVNSIEGQQPTTECYAN